MAVADSAVKGVRVGRGLWYTRARCSSSSFFTANRDNPTAAPATIPALRKTSTPREPKHVGKIMIQP
jgi:hypothetical protein